MIFIAFFLFIFTTLPARAATLSNDSYMIETKNINLEKNISEIPTSGSLKTAEFPPSFTFSLSDIIIDFGELSATNPVERTTTLGIFTGAALGFSILATEDHEPSSFSAVIPDTWCDNGSCTDRLSSPWENVLTYGFGYRLEGESGYRQFANQTKGEMPQPVFESSAKPNDKKEKQIKILYKLNIPKTQEQGAYANTIRYIAVPDF